MSLGKRLLHVARANLNALLDRAAERTLGDPIQELSDEDLEQELERRKLRRLREDEERRKREAAERAARLRAEARAAEVGRQRQSRATSQTAGERGRPSDSGATSTGTSSRASGSSATARPTAARPTDELYRQLGVPYGAPFDEVKRAFRQLMRQHHPDLHGDSEEQRRAATARSMQLTEAFRELERRLGVRG
jgi:DnaJ-domain-containing protein 1